MVKMVMATSLSSTAAWVCCLRPKASEEFQIENTPVFVQAQRRVHARVIYGHKEV